MAWTYNGNKSFFANLVVQNDLTVQGNEIVNGQLEVVGNSFLDSQLLVGGNQFNRGAMSVENEKYITTLRPVIQPGPVLRTTPNIQFQPRTKVGVTAATTGGDQLLCTLLPTGMVTISGSLVISQAARVAGYVIADLGNTALESRLLPAITHRFHVDGSAGTTDNGVQIVLGPAGNFQIFNASNAAGNLTYYLTGFWLINSVQVAGIFYGNGGY